MHYFIVLVLGLVPTTVYAYTPLITATTFDGVRADVNSVSLGMIGLFLIVAALGLIIKGMLGR